MDLTPEMERLLERLLAGEELAEEERALLTEVPELDARAGELAEVQALLDSEGASERVRLASGGGDEAAEERAAAALAAGLRARRGWRARPISAAWWMVAAAAVVLVVVSLFAVFGGGDRSDGPPAYLMLSQPRPGFRLEAPGRLADGSIRLSWVCEDPDVTYYAGLVWGEALRVGAALLVSPELEEPHWTLDATEIAGWPAWVEIEIIAYEDDGTELDHVELALDVR